MSTENKNLTNFPPAAHILSAMGSTPSREWEPPEGGGH